MNINKQAIRELARILSARGVSTSSGVIYAGAVEDRIGEYVAWLKENPEATKTEIARKAIELGKTP